MVYFSDAPRACDDAAPRTGDPGRLFLWFPVGLALKKVRSYLARIERQVATSTTGALVVDTPEGYPGDLVLDLAELLTADESADTRCVFKIGSGELDVDDIQRVRTINELRQLERSSWLINMVRDERLTSLFQPIVHSSQPSRVLGHEAFVRGIHEDGRRVSPGPLFDAARDCGIVPELDCAARRSAIRAAAHHDERRPLFLNFNPDAVRDGEAHNPLARTIAAIDAVDLPRERVVFEVVDAERTNDVRHLRRVLDGVRDSGFRVALDDVGCAEQSRRLIHEVRPDFVKLDMERVRMSALPHLGDAERLMDLAVHLKIETIAEGVETGEELEWNRERGATYVQGYFIAKPSAVPA